MYTIIWSKTASKDVRKLPRQYVGVIITTVEALNINARPSMAKKLKGYKDLYRLRQGDYRIIYQINQGQLVVLVLEIGHRREIYRNF